MKAKVFRTRSEKRGGHWYVTMFSADSYDHTFANCGTLVMDDEDFRSFVGLFTAQHLAVGDENFSREKSDE